MSSGPSAAKEKPLSGESSCIEETPRSSRIAEAFNLFSFALSFFDDDGGFRDDGDDGGGGDGGVGERVGAGGVGAPPLPERRGASSSETASSAPSMSLKLASRTQTTGGEDGKASETASESARPASSLARASTSRPTTAPSRLPSAASLLTSAEAWPPAPRVPST